MDLTSKAIKNLERLKRLRKRRLELESWHVSNEIPVGDNEELEIYNLRRLENVTQMSETVKMITDIKEVLKYINRIEQIKIPLDSKFARRAQGLIISSALLPSGLLMYHAVDNHQWVVRGKFAVLEKFKKKIKIVEVD